MSCILLMSQRKSPRTFLSIAIGYLVTLAPWRDFGIKKNKNRSLDRREILYWSRGYSLRSWIKGVLNHWHTIGHTLLAVHTVCLLAVLDLFYHRWDRLLRRIYYLIQAAAGCIHPTCKYRLYVLLPSVFCPICW